MLQNLLAHERERVCSLLEFPRLMRIDWGPLLEFRVLRLNFAFRTRERERERESLFPSRERKKKNHKAHLSTIEKVSNWHRVRTRYRMDRYHLMDRRSE